MEKLVLTKEIVEYVDQLGWNDCTQKEPSFEEKAKRTLEGFHSSRWNSGYIKFIAENLEKIERAAQGEEAVYPIMTIYKNVKSGELEAEEWIQKIGASQKREQLEPCEYCEKQKEISNDWVELKVINGHLDINYDAYSLDSSFETEIKITHCPMCGQKLEVEE